MLNLWPHIKDPETMLPIDTTKSRTLDLNQFRGQTDHATQITDDHQRLGVNRSDSSPRAEPVSSLSGSVLGVQGS